MPRRRFIQDPKTLELVEVSADFSPISLPTDSGALWGDRNYDGLRATDGVAIDTRTKHRQYMKERGLAMHEDFKGEWKDAEKRRADVFTGVDPTRKQDVERAFHKSRGY